MSMIKKIKRKQPVQGRPSDSKSEERRKYILDNALALFAQQGVAGTTIAQIATASGVTPAMVHYYFGNREGLLDRIVTDRLAPALEYIWAGISSQALTDPRQTMTAFADRLLEIVDRMPHFPALWSREIINAAGSLRPRIESIVPFEKFEKVCSVFMKAQQEGRINAQVIPSLVITSAVSIIMLHLSIQDIVRRIPVFHEISRASLRQHVLALLLDGLCPQHGQEE